MVLQCLLQYVYIHRNVCVYASHVWYGYQRFILFSLDLFLYFLLALIVPVRMCLKKCLWLCEGPKLKSGSFFVCSLLCFLITRSLIEPRTAIFAILANQQFPWIYRCLLNDGVTGVCHSILLFMWVLVNPAIYSNYVDTRFWFLIFPLLDI